MNKPDNTDYNTDLNTLTNMMDCVIYLIDNINKKKYSKPLNCVKDFYPVLYLYNNDIVHRIAISRPQKDAQVHSPYAKNFSELYSKLFFYIHKFKNDHHEYIDLDIIRSFNKDDENMEYKQKSKELYQQYLSSHPISTQK